MPHFHGPFEGRQGFRRERIDAFGDAALRLRQAVDVGKDRLVTVLGLCGACATGHGGQQLDGDGFRGLAWSGFRLRGLGFCLYRCLCSGFGGCLGGGLLDDDCAWHRRTPIVGCAI
jgi:hypothetical protein